MSANAFLRAICERPDDDWPRLVYADWLDEQGRAEQAEFIRIQCELARRERPVEIKGSLATFDHGDDYDDLKRREMELLSHAQQWVPNFPGKNFVLFHRGADLGPLADILGPFAAANGISVGYCEFSRGLVREVIMTAADFMGGPQCERCRGWTVQYNLPPYYRCPACGRTGGVAADMFRQAPIEAVTLGDRTPSFFDGHYNWFDDRRQDGINTGPCYVHAAIYDKMIELGYTFDHLSEPTTSSLRTLGDARDLLSDACVAVSRSLAFPKTKALTANG